MSPTDVPSPGVVSARPSGVLGMTLADRYRITRPLAEGGMGAVFLGVDEHTGNEVAIKVMRGELARSEEALARFRREVRAVATLDSPHIVTAHDAGTVDGMPYLVMERLQGRGLDELAEAGEIDARRAVTIIIDLLAGLSHAHAAGIIHRDLKPSNVWITNDDRVKILDFGVAKMQGAARSAGDETGKLTGSGAVLGSPAYMSPEQLVSSKEAGVQADLWSVGVVLYELLTGSMLFKAETVGGIFANVIRMPIPPLREVMPGVSPELERIVARCLERDPELRFPSAENLADELRAVVDADACGDATWMQPGAARRPKRADPTANTLADAPTVALPRAPQIAERPHGAGPARGWLAGLLFLIAVAALGVVAFVATRPSSEPSSRPSDEPIVTTTPETVKEAHESPTVPTPSAEAESPAPTVDATPPKAPPAALTPPLPSASTKVAPEDDLWETSRH